MVISFKLQGPVARRSISANPGVNTKLFFSVQKLFEDNFLHLFSEHSINKLKTKRFKLNFFFKLSDLKSNFILTLGYLNPALNNPAQKYKSTVITSQKDVVCLSLAMLFNLMYWCFSYSLSSGVCIAVSVGF